MKNTNKEIEDVLAEASLSKNYQAFLEEAQTKIKIGSELFKAREKARMSQRDLAKLVGTTQKVISRIESGDVNPGICLLERIAQKMKIRLSFGDATLVQQGMTIEDILQFGSREGSKFSPGIVAKPVGEVLNFDK